MLNNKSIRNKGNECYGSLNFWKWALATKKSRLPKEAARVIQVFISMKEILHFIKKTFFVLAWFRLEVRRVAQRFQRFTFVR